jgi:hypothetical protein
MYRTGNPGYIAVIMIMATLTILVVGAIGVEAAIQRRILAPPQLDLRVGSLHLLAFSMGPQQVPACSSRSPILNDPNSLAACSQHFYVVLVLIQTGILDNKLWILQLLNVPIREERGPGILGVLLFAAHKEAVWRNFVPPNRPFQRYTHLTAA